VNRLPACYSTLYILSQIDDEFLKAAIADGRISPKMMRKDAFALRKSKSDATEDHPPGDGPAEPPTRPNELELWWDIATDAEKSAVMKREGMGRILKLLENDKDLLADLYGRAIGLQAALAAPVIPSKAANNLLSNLTGTLHWALGQEDVTSGAQALTIIKAKLAVNKRDPKDICLAFAKKGRR
jgi:hypothetical protein